MQNRQFIELTKVDNSKFLVNISTIVYIEDKGTYRNITLAIIEKTSPKYQETYLVNMCFQILETYAKIKEEIEDAS